VVPVPGDIAASDDDIAAMVAQLQTANPGIVLPPDFGKSYDPEGNQQNWPVPQVVLMNWMADTTFDYGPRDNTAIPDSMGAWMGTCDNTMYWDQASCTGNGGVWTAGRHTFDYTGSAVFSAYLELQEDLSILQMKRSELWMTNPGATGPSRRKTRRCSFRACRGSGTGSPGTRRAYPSPPSRRTPS